jgi:VanZ family protein
MFSRRLVLAWLPAALYMLLIWWLSSQSLTISTVNFPFRDKGVHATEYGVLGVFLAHALSGTFIRSAPPRLWLWSVALTVLFGMSDEIHQAFVPGRSADILDLVADAVGAVMGASLRLFVLSRWTIFKHADTPALPEQETDA